MEDDEFDAKMIESYIFELSERISELETENESLKKALERKIDMVKLLEMCVLGEGDEVVLPMPPLPPLQNTDEAVNIPEESNILLHQMTPQEIAQRLISYKKVENLLIKRGMFTHPKVVERLLNAGWGNSLENNL